MFFPDFGNILGVHVYPEGGGQDLSVHVQQEDAPERVRLIEGLHAYEHTPTTLTYKQLLSTVTHTDRHIHYRQTDTHHTTHTHTHTSHTAQHPHSIADKDTAIGFYCNIKSSE